MIGYRVLIEIDTGEWDYIRQPEEGETYWTITTPIKNFFSKQAAIEEAERWNTGRVIEFNTDGEGSYWLK